MEIWQLAVTIASGVIVILNLIERLGITKAFKDTQELKEVPELIEKLTITVEKMSSRIQIQDQAILSMLRNDLYKSFKEHRDIGAWTDEECSVQTKIHESYIAMGGNGTEALWWEKKKQWKIVTEQEYNRLIKESRNCNE